MRVYILRINANNTSCNELKYFKRAEKNGRATKRNGTRGEAECFLGDVKRPELNISLDDGGKPVKCRGSP